MKRNHLVNYEHDEYHYHPRSVRQIDTVSRTGQFKLTCTLCANVLFTKVSTMHNNLNDKHPEVIEMVKAKNSGTNVLGSFTKGCLFKWKPHRKKSKQVVSGL